MRFAVLLLLLASTPAFADHEPVRDDIVDLRHNRWPNRRVFLGWTATNQAVIHVAICSLDGAGGATCRSTLEVVSATRPKATLLIEPPCNPCDDPYGKNFAWAVSTELASRAIRAERAALEALGPLQPSAVGTPPAVQVAADTCRVDLVVDKRRIAGVLRPTRRCLDDGGDNSFSGARLRNVQLSPDHRKLAVTFTVGARFLEWTDPIDVTVVVDAPTDDAPRVRPGNTE